MNNVKELKLKIHPILKKHGVIRSSVFGSFARGENKAESDIDILVKLKDGKTLIDLISLESDLEKVTNWKVDLLTYNSINPLLREQILKDEVLIYG